MRAILVVLAAISLIGLSGPAITKEPVLLNCRLMTAADPWLFRQHCKWSDQYRWWSAEVDRLECGRVRSAQFQIHKYQRAIRRLIASG